MKSLISYATRRIFYIIKAWLLSTLVISSSFAMTIVCPEIECKSSDASSCEGFAPNWLMEIHSSRATVGHYSPTHAIFLQYDNRDDGRGSCEYRDPKTKEAKIVLFDNYLDLSKSLTVTNPNEWDNVMSRMFECVLHSGDMEHCAFKTR